MTRGYFPVPPLLLAGVVGSGVVLSGAGDFRSAQDFEARLVDYLEGYNTHMAHPYRWTYTGQPLVRATPFSQTRRQQRHGRAWFSSRPQRFERTLYPPRPYKRAAAGLAANL